MARKQEKLAIRILRLLASAKEAEMTRLEDAGTVRHLLQSNTGAKILVTAQIMDTLHKAGLVDLITIDGENSGARLTHEGQSKLARMEAPSDEFATQHRNLTKGEVRINGAKHTALVNLNESPLLRLSTRKTKSGKPWLAPDHVEAGERLRRDFTHGHLMQKVSSNWDFSSGNNRVSGAGGKAELSGSAIDARKRLRSALDFVGPELACVLTDVCCFLKGLESVEREQKWPPRSAKLMLRTGLDLLARHYGTKPGSFHHS